MKKTQAKDTAESITSWTTGQSSFLSLLFLPHFQALGKQSYGLQKENTCLYVPLNKLKAFTLATFGLGTWPAKSSATSLAGLL